MTTEMNHPFNCIVVSPSRACASGSSSARHPEVMILPYQLIKTTSFLIDIEPIEIPREVFHGPAYPEAISPHCLRSYRLEEVEPGEDLAGTFVRNCAQFG